MASNASPSASASAPTADTGGSAIECHGLDAPVSAGKCKTPGVYYQTSMTSPTTLQVRMKFPFAIEDWARGNSAVTEGPKLQRYDQQAAERKRIDDLIHDQMEVVGADCFRVIDIVHRAYTTGYPLAASEWNEEVGGRPFTVTDWNELTFGEQRTYAERSAVLSSDPPPPGASPAERSDRTREDHPNPKHTSTKADGV